MKLSIVLKKLIQTKGLTITNLSKASSVPTQTIHNWIAGAEPRSITQLKAVADILEVDLDYLCFGETSVPKNENTLIEEINAGIFEVILRKPQ